MKTQKTRKHTAASRPKHKNTETAYFSVLRRSRVFFVFLFFRVSATLRKDTKAQKTRKHEKRKEVPQMPTEALLLDFDGTVLNSSIRGESAQRRFFEIAEGLGLSVTEEHKKKVAELWGAHNPRKIVAECWPKQDFEVFIRAWCAMDALPLYMPPLVPLARETLYTLKHDGFFLGILTDRDIASAKSIMRAYEIWHLFDLVWTRDDSPKGGKGNPDTARQVVGCLRRRGIEKQNTLLVGDAWVDLECARAARFQFIGVLSGFSAESEFLSFGVSLKSIIPSIAALPALLKQSA